MPRESTHEKTTLIYTHGGGRFANQLMMFGHLIALAEEHREFEIVDYAFWRFADHCAGTENNPMCRYPLDSTRRRWPARFANKLRSVSPNQLSRVFRHLTPTLAHKLWLPSF